MLALHTSGSYVLDSNNSIVYLRGVNRPHLHDYAGGSFGDWGVYSSGDVADELSAMQKWGCNVLRLTTCADYWISDTQTTSGSGTIGHRKVIKDICEIAATKGIYVVYCPWNITSGSDQPSIPFPPYISGSDADVFPNAQAFVDFWGNVASELSGYNNVLFEIFNEAHGSDTGNNTGSTEYTAWKEACADCVDTIRNSGSTNPIIIQWQYGAVPDKYQNPIGRWNLQWIIDMASLITGSNIIWSTHCYRDSGNWSGSANQYDYATVLDNFGRNCAFDDICATYPVWMGEVGANIWWSDQDLINELSWFSNILSGSNLQWGIGYAAWIWWSPGFPHSLIDDGSPWNDTATPNHAGQLLIDALSGSSQNFSISTTGPYSAYTGSPSVNLNYSISYGNQPYNIDVYWGDGTSGSDTQTSTGSFSKNNVYPATVNTYTLTVSGSDSGSNLAYATTSVSITGSSETGSSGGYWIFYSLGRFT